MTSQPVCLWRPSHSATCNRIRNLLLLCTMLHVGCVDCPMRCLLDAMEVSFLFINEKPKEFVLHNQLPNSSGKQGLRQCDILALNQLRKQTPWSQCHLEHP